LAAATDSQVGYEFEPSSWGEKDAQCSASR
jgi:hypothetical protein